MQNAILPNKSIDRAKRISQREIAKGKLWAGLGLLLLGITGVYFSFMTGLLEVFPLTLFAPVLVCAFGVLGMIMGIAEFQGNPR